MSRTTANKAYRKYRREENGTLPFKEWLNREKAKGFVGFDGVQNEPPLNKPLTDSIQRSIDEMHRQSGYQDHLGGPYILGIHRTYLIIAGVTIIGAAAAYLVYKNRK